MASMIMRRTNWGLVLRSMGWYRVGSHRRVLRAMRSAATLRTHGFTNRSAWKTVGIGAFISGASFELVGVPASLAEVPRLGGAISATGDVACAVKCPDYYP